MGAAAAVRAVTPPVVWQAVRRLRNHRPPPADISFVGDYASYEAAVADCGAAPFEREQIIGYWRERTPVPAGRPLSDMALRQLAALQYVALRTDHALRVVDFGGALGRHYHEYRRHLPGSVTWDVVEVPGLADVGNEHFASDELRFHSSVAALPARPVDVVLVAGSLQSVPDPRDHLRQLVALGSKWMIVDRLPLIPGADRLTVETVPDGIYGGKYPAWFLSEQRFMAAMAGWEIVFEWLLPEERMPLDAELVTYRGWLFRRH